MIEVEGMIANQPIAIWIDLGAIHSYIPLNMVSIFHLKRCKNYKSWFVQLATGTRRKINELVKGYPLVMNGLHNFAYWNIIPLGSYDVLIGMDWLYAPHFLLYYRNKTLTCLNEERNQVTVKGIPRPISIRKSTSLQMKRLFRKGCQLYAAHVEESGMEKGPKIEDFPILHEYADVFKEILRLPPKIYFFIYLLGTRSRPRLYNSIQN